MYDQRVMWAGVLKGIRSLLLVALWLCACESERRESPACIAARDAVDGHLKQGELEEARAALHTAETQCGKASGYALERLGRAIEREARHQQREAQLISERQDPLDRFLAWVVKEREEKNRAKGEHHCPPRESPDYGFCISKLSQAEHPPFVVTYWKAAPDQDFRFSWQTSEPISCVDLGPHRLVSSRQTAEGTSQLCELTEHNVRGLKVLITRENQSSIDVFSAGYLRRDAEFAARVGRQ